MRIIGLMSGTSVDGIDAALVEIQGEPGQYDWKLLSFLCVPWPPELRDVILNLLRTRALFLDRLTVLNVRLGEEFAKAARAVAEQAGVALDTVDAIASHGQTVWHQPKPLEVGGGEATGTLQLGEPAILAARTGCLVVADFRAADMALGGQGAPLVPFADYALFASPTETRAMQNIGGIGNVTYLPAGGSLEDVLAFDTGPGNMVLDELTRRVTRGRHRFDAEGALAAKGAVNSEVLNGFVSFDYFHLPPPKSTGREEFGAEFATWFLKASERVRLSPADTLATATALTAESIARAYRDFLLPRAPIDTVILGGGGVHNRTLVRMLEERLAPARITTHAAFGLPDDAKEAFAFALLAYETLHNRPSNVPSATGASGQAILGKIVLPPRGGKLRLRLDKAEPFVI